MSRIEIKDIDKSAFYEGYLWMSDKNEPEVYHYEKAVEFSLFEKKNPFVIEGQLYNKDKGISYSIKYVDGEYIINEIHVLETDKGDPNVKIQYYPNRMGNYMMEFLQYWEEENDPLCENMPVLKLSKIVFVGFKK